MTPSRAEHEILDGDFRHDTMTPHDDVQHRRAHTPDPAHVRVRDDDDSDDGMFRIRMPLSSTAEARDGEAFTRDRLEGWQAQIEAEPLPLFLDHGHDDLSGSRYGALSKVGYWDDPELVDRDGYTDLDADAVIVDPETLDTDVGDIRERLNWLKEQADRGLPIASSAGWKEDTGDRDVPGGSDLLEGSIVGIPSDARTTTASASPAVLARAVSAASDGFDVETFVRELEAVDLEDDDTDRTMTDDTDAGDEAGDETDESTDAREGEKDDDYGERLDRLEEMNREELQILREMADDGDDDDDDEDDDDEEGENADDTDDTDERSVTIDGEELSADEALERLREVAADDPDPEDPATRDVGDDADAEGEEADPETRDDEPDETDDGPSYSFS